MLLLPSNPRGIELSWHSLHCQVYAKLTGAHKSAVTKLLVLGGREQGGPDMLLSCSTDGTVAVWEPSATAPQGPDKEISAKVPSARVPSHSNFTPLQRAAQ